MQHPAVGRTAGPLHDPAAPYTKPHPSAHDTTQMPTKTIDAISIADSRPAARITSRLVE